MTLQEIEKEVNTIGAFLGAPEHLIPTFGHSDDFAKPHIEVDKKGFHYIIVERGQERHRETTKNKNQLLFIIFKSISFSMAVDFELSTRP